MGCSALFAFTYENAFPFISESCWEGLIPDIDWCLQQLIALFVVLTVCVKQFPQFLKRLYLRAKIGFKTVGSETCGFS